MRCTCTYFDVICLLEDSRSAALDVFPFLDRLGLSASCLLQSLEICLVWFNWRAKNLIVTEMISLLYLQLVGNNNNHYLTHQKYLTLLEERGWVWLSECWIQASLRQYIHLEFCLFPMFVPTTFEFDFKVNSIKVAFTKCTSIKIPSSVQDYLD